MLETFEDVAPPIDGNPKGKNVLSMRQFSADDIDFFIDEAYAASASLEDLGDDRAPGVPLLEGRTLKAVMRQPSTRTAGTMTTAMDKLRGGHDLISGMASSSEAKGETLEDSWVAFATQADVIGTRTAEEYGPHLAAKAIQQSYLEGNLSRVIPIINLGDGRNEHPTQTLGDLYTIHRIFNELGGLTLAIVGDHERYRAHHSLMLGAFTVGMQVIAVETEVAQVPDEIADLANGNLKRTTDLNEAMEQANVLYIGRQPDEYNGRKWREKRRSKHLDRAYERWVVDYARLQIMSPDSIVLHPRPRRKELHPSADRDPRTRDVQQMENMIPMRMAILAGVFGKSIRKAA